MREHADKIMLLTALAMLIVAAWLFRDNAQAVLLLIGGITGISGTMAGISSGRPRSVTQQNIDSTVSAAPVPDGQK